MSCVSGTTGSIYPTAFGSLCLIATAELSNSFAFSFADVNIAIVSLTWTWDIYEFAADLYNYAAGNEF